MTLSLMLQNEKAKDRTEKYNKQNIKLVFTFKIDSIDLGYQDLHRSNLTCAATDVHPGSVRLFREVIRGN